MLEVTNTLVQERCIDMLDMYLHKRASIFDDQAANITRLPVIASGNKSVIVDVPEQALT